jgi:glycosidase
MIVKRVQSSGAKVRSLCFVLLSVLCLVWQAHGQKQYGTPFDRVPDPRDVSIYQVNMRVFSPEGNFRGVTARLDSIKALGFNVVYLMPIYPVGQKRSVNSPYCIRDYTAVNKEFGTLEDLRHLVKESHARGMAVILDWVANHTAYDHPWTENKSWYLQDDAGNIISPPGMGWNDVAQLNFKNQDMRNALIASMKYWVLEANIDGFRCDYSDGPPHDFWKQTLDTLRSIKSHSLLMLSEGRRSDHFKAGFDYNFGFGFFHHLKEIFAGKESARVIDTLNTRDHVGAGANHRMVRYTSNHDVNGSDGTPLELFGGKRGSMAAFVIAAFMKSVPMLYNGQEVGTPYRLTFPFTSTKIDWTLNPDLKEEYRKLIAFRNGSAAIRRGEMISHTTDDVCAFTKKEGSETVLVVVNVRNRPVTYSVPATVRGNWKEGLSGKAVKLNKKIELEPYRYLIFRK